MATESSSRRISGTTPRITFGVIVLNGEPFTRYALRSVYPFAHEIIVAEGAVPAARSIARPDGHSSDGTLEELQRFQEEDDWEGKLTIVTAEDEGHPNGFWPGEKHEQSQAYAKRATGDYLWQVDIDEFYLPRDMKTILQLLRDSPTITGMSFRQLSFWGGLNYVADGWYLARGGSDFHRLFRWGPGYAYANHRPPTVVDGEGRDLRAGNWLDVHETMSRGIRLFHYSLLFPKQVAEKAAYYAAAPWAKHAQGSREWADEAYRQLRRPFRVHNVYTHPSWLTRYRGPHPPAILEMLRELPLRDSEIELRQTDDIERLLRRPSYRAQAAALKALDHVDRAQQRLRGWARRLLR